MDRRRRISAHRSARRDAWRWRGRWWTMWGRWACRYAARCWSRRRRFPVRSWMLPRLGRPHPVLASRLCCSWRARVARRKSLWLGGTRYLPGAVVAWGWAHMFSLRSVGARARAACRGRAFRPLPRRAPPTNALVRGKLVVASPHPAPSPPVDSLVPDAIPVLGLVDDMILPCSPSLLCRLFLRRSSPSRERLGESRVHKGAGGFLIAPAWAEMTGTAIGLHI